jgi:serine/threonine protein kinase
MSEAAAPQRPANHSVLPPGKVIGGRYAIERTLGDGAQGVVYLARRIASGDGGPGVDRVALKVIHRHLCGNDQIFKRFHREAKILGRLEGEHVVRLLDFVEDDGLLAIALEHVEGISLEAALAQRSPLDPKQAIEISLQVCAALGAAHAAGIVHRDLKPANVLIEGAGSALGPGAQPGSSGWSPGRGPAPSSVPSSASDLRVKVLDFGLAKVVHGDAATTGLTEHGMIFGTPEYMAPEQARGDETDARSDLYAAGVMLYEMLVGRTPFTGKSAIGVMTAHLSDDPPSPRALRPGGAISPALEAVVLRALAKDPADRFPTARDLAEAIAVARDEPRVIKPVSAPSGPIDDLATSDTDLNLDPPSLGSAETLRAPEVAALKQHVDASVPVRIEPAPPRIPSDPAPSTMPSALAPDDLTPSGLPAPRRWIWAVVALVAAAIGIVLGALAGSAR